MNYFKLFKIDESFKLDKKKLSKKFYKLQKKFHPDMNIKKTKEEIKNNLKKSILINNAYNILKNSYKRAKYIIEINYSKKHEKKNYNLKFLNYCFNINDEIEKEYKNEKREKKLIKILNEIKKKKKKYYVRIERYLNKKRWKKSKKILIKLNFINKIYKKLKYKIINK
ncbi:Fe-S protein assembly co-chaperone HscB [Buchnera aphidicola (Ceratoglyphina bambusae)]|uniref:Fe-S protein assembly co-chaperone HscB n=1 Tax=Buchnera aphidicola TaxID=9 RepID=UPI0031B849CE